MVLTIRPGTWIISQPLIISGNLKVEPGTNLIFKKDSYLIVKAIYSLKVLRKARLNLQLSQIHGKVCMYWGMDHRLLLLILNSLLPAN